MKTVTSEDHLTRYVVGERGVEVIDPAALNRKIKSIKSALKLSEHHNKDLERHNRELHLQIKSLKDKHQVEIGHLENECRKHKQLYEMLTENYEAKCLELKETKRRLKRVEGQQAQNAGVQLSLQEAEETTRQYRQAILKQEREMSRLREENKLLYDQLYEKSSRLKDLEPLLTKNYSTKSEKDKTFLANLRAALQGKNQEFEKLMFEKNQLTTSRSALEKQNGDLGVKIARLATELEYQRRTSNESKEKLNRQEKECSRLAEELRVMSAKYSELLGFSYELQRDFERDLQTALKEVGRKDKQ